MQLNTVIYWNYVVDRKIIDKNQQHPNTRPFEIWWRGILITAYIPIQSANERLKSNTSAESNVTTLSIISFGMFLYLHKKLVSIDAQADLTFSIAIRMFLFQSFSH